MLAFGRVCCGLGPSYSRLALPSTPNFQALSLSKSFRSRLWNAYVNFSYANNNKRFYSQPPSPKIQWEIGYSTTVSHDDKHCEFNLHVDDKDSRGNSRLHKAAKHGDKEWVKLLLQKGADINVRAENGATPLWSAVCANQIEMVTLLIENGAKVDSPNDSGYTALHIAAQMGYTEIIRLLVSSGANINYIAPQNSFTPLMHAIFKDQFNAFLLLLSLGADVDIVTNKEGFNAVYLAAEQGYLRLLEILLPISKYDGTGLALCSAVRANNWACMRELLKYGAIIDHANYYGQTPIYLAVMNGELDIACELLSKINGRDVKEMEGEGYGVLIDHLKSSTLDPERFRNLLHCAAKFNNVELIKHLVSNGSDINQEDDDGNTVISCAIYYEKLDALNTLCEIGANTNKYLLACAETDNARAIPILVKHGADVNYPGVIETGPPLFYAISRNKLEAASVLLQHGASVDQMNHDNYTALHAAETVEAFDLLLNNNADMKVERLLHYHCQEGRTEIVKRILELNVVEIDAMTETYNPAINYALTHPSIITLLLDAGAATSFKTSQGEFFSHFAALNASPEVMKILIERNKMDVECKDNDGYTPVCYCVQRADADAVDVLHQILSLGVSVHAHIAGTTLLHYAAQSSPIMVKELINLGLNINKIDEFGRTAIFHCCKETLPILIERGADINRLSEKEGNNILHTAVEGEEELELIEMMVKSGVNLHCRNKEGKTPLELAEKEGQIEVVEFLKKCIN